MIKPQRKKTHISISCRWVEEMLLYIHLLKSDAIACIFFLVGNCCNFFPYEDPRCYLELVNGQYLVRPNAAGTHIDFHTCNIATGEINSQQSQHTHGNIIEVTIYRLLWARVLCVLAINCYNFLYMFLYWRVQSSALGRKLLCFLAQFYFILWTYFKFKRQQQ